MSYITHYDNPTNCMRVDIMILEANYNIDKLIIEELLILLDKPQKYSTSLLEKNLGKYIYIII